MGPRLVIITFGVILGVAVGVALYKSYGPKDRTRSLLITSVAIGCGVFALNFAAYPIAHSMAKASKVGGYHQMFNGSLVQAVKDRHPCRKVEEGSSSGCQHNSSCDPYTVTKYRTVYSTDAKGNTTSRQEPYTETEYHVCPHGTVEYSYYLYDNFKNQHVVASHIYGEDTRPAYGSLGDVPRTVPMEWLQARDRIARGDAPPVTIDETYENYILGSEVKLLRSYSDDITSLKRRNLLPRYPARIHGYTAEKVMFVGGARPTAPDTPAAWQDRLMRFNASFGMQKQGDLYIVAVDINALPADIDPEDYVRALKAYWQGSFGKYSLAKNAVVLAMGINSTTGTIQWARAETGMPGGNGEMTELLKLRLQDQKFDSAAVLGTTTAAIIRRGKKLKPTYTVGAGVVPQVVMTDKPFERACMGCTGKEDKGHGYVDLQDLIPLSGWATFWTCFILLVIAVMVYAASVAGYTFVTVTDNRFMYAY